MIKALQDQDSGPPDKIINFTSINKNENKSVAVLNSDCKDAYLTFEFDHRDINHNHIKGVVSFKNPEDVLKTTLNIKSDDNVPDLVRNIKFPYGLILDYSYEDAKANKPMIFTGQMDFMSVHTHGEYSLYSWNYTSLANIELPTIKIGGGNFQFISHDDLFYHYNLNDDQNSKEFDSRTLDIRANFDDLKKKNTLKFMLEKGKLDQTQILLESNILIFEMVGRISTYLNEDLMTFSLQGRPFKGVFEANTTVEVKPVDDLEAETNSVLKMELLENDHLKDLEKWTNYNLQTWVTRIIKVTEEAKILRDKFNTELKSKQDAYVPADQCESYEQCEEMPSIICEEYAQKAVCKEEKKVCLTMTQVCAQQTEVCTRTNKEGECQEKILKCDKWENKCKDDETTTVCVDFEDEDIPNNCLIMELVCKSTTKQDQECVSQSKQMATEIEDLKKDISRVEHLLKHIKQLQDSSVCVMRRSKAKDAKYDCTLKDESVTVVEDNIEILDLFDIKTIYSSMKLNKVIASDRILFNSDVWLYGDWTNRVTKAEDNLITKKSLNIEEEKAEDGYNSGAKSLINVKHIVQFDNVNQTALEISNSVRKIVCKEFGIQGKESDEIQIAITEFALLDGNSTICPLYEELDTSGVSNGLYSETEGSAFLNKNNGKGQLGQYDYNFAEGRKKISITQEQIADYEKLSYKTKKQENPKDVSLAEAVLDDIDGKEEVTAAPSQKTSDLLNINVSDRSKENKNNNESEEPKPQDNSQTIKEIQDISNKEEDAKQVKDHQMELDANREKEQKAAAEEAKKAEEEKQKQAAEAEAKRKADEQAAQEAAKKEAEAKAAEQKAAADKAAKDAQAAQDAAKKAAEDKAKAEKEAQEKAAKEAEEKEKAAKAAQEKAQKEAEERDRAAKEAEENAKKQIEEQKKAAEEAEKQKQEAEKAAQEAEQQKIQAEEAAKKAADEASLKQQEAEKEAAKASDDAEAKKEQAANASKDADDLAEAKKAQEAAKQAEEEAQAKKEALEAAKAENESKSAQAQADADKIAQENKEAAAQKSAANDGLNIKVIHS